MTFADNKPGNIPCVDLESTMKKLLTLAVLSLSLNLFASETAFTNLHTAILHNIVHQELLVKKEQEEFVIGVMKKLETGNKFLKEINCVSEAEKSVDKANSCLNNVYIDNPKSFKNLYENEFKVLISALKNFGFITRLF